MDTVSVIMPCYKAANTLEKAVYGIQAQLHEHWELLLIIDGAADNTAELAQKLAAGESRIRIVNSIKNRGVVRARNLGIRLAKGNWIAFCDADDYWLPHKLKLQLELARQHRANMVYASFYFWYPQLESHKLKMVSLPSPLRYETMLRTNAVPMSTALYATAELGKHYFTHLPQGYIHEDYAYWLTFMKSSRVKTVYVTEPLVYIRIHENSRSSNKWQAMRSHAYILQRFAGLNVVQLGLAMGSYLFWGVFKRLGTKQHNRFSDN